MQGHISKIKEFVLDVLFPKFCLNCNKEGSYLCEDCFYLIDVFNKQYCPYCKKISEKTCSYCQSSENLDGLFCAASYDNFIVRKMIKQFKDKPYAKELAKPLAFLIIAHLIVLDKERFNGFSMLPVPISKKERKQIGFSPAEEIAKELSGELKIPLLDKVSEDVKNRNILLVDPVFSNYSAMKECASVLKKAGAKEVWAMTTAISSAS